MYPFRQNMCIQVYIYYHNIHNIHISRHIPPKKTLLGKYSTWVCAESGHTPHLQFQVEEAYWTTDHWILGYLILDRSIPLVNYILTLQYFSIAMEDDSFIEAFIQDLPMGLTVCDVQ